MRIWSISPKYLDPKGLVALWRETLLAKNVLAGNTVGYRNHPQLVRFKQQTNPLAAIDTYLGHIYDEALHRNYKFDKNKFTATDSDVLIPVTSGQLAYELAHLRKKLEVRAPELVIDLPTDGIITSVPIFTEVPGDIEDWEIT